MPGAVTESGSFARRQELEEKLPESPMEQVETALRLQMAVRQPSIEMQELVLIRYVNGLSGKEILKITGMSLATCPRNLGITLTFPPWIS